MAILASLGLPQIYPVWHLQSLHDERQKLAQKIHFARLTSLQKSAKVNFCWSQVCGSPEGWLLLTVLVVILLVAAGVVMLMSQAHLSLRMTRQDKSIRQSNKRSTNGRPSFSIGRMSMPHDQDGFSLMELLLVLVLISVIVDMAVPAWWRNQLAAGCQQAWLQLHRIGLKHEMWHLQYGHYFTEIASVTRALDTLH